MGGDKTENLPEGAGGLVKDGEVELQVGNTPEADNDTHGNICIHGFWYCGTVCIFNIWMTDTDAARYRGALRYSVLANQEKEKNML